MAASLAQLQSEHNGSLADPRALGAHAPQAWLMATGIECSYPTVQNGRRRDELEATKHYTRWREDFALCKSIGARYLRYGLPYYRMHVGPGRYDWSFADEVLPALWDSGIVPIIDLCHFGVPDWIGSFQNDDWPALFAAYAAAFAERYPWIKFYTPVNEMLVCARFSGKYGLWNEQQRSDGTFVTALVNECRATLLAIGEILKRRKDAVFIQSEIAEAYIERFPKTRAEVQFRNHFRFVTLDFLYGYPPYADVLMFLYDNGFRREDYEWFIAHGREAAQFCVLGMDYYANNERTIAEDGTHLDEGLMLGWAPITLDYYDRFRRPLMLTETNTLDDGHGHSVEWLLQTWHQANYLRHHGVPVLGYTWYSLIDQVDWDIQLREIRNVVNANGLFTMDREPRDVANVYRELATHYGDSPLIETLPAGMRAPLNANE